MKIDRLLGLVSVLANNDKITVQELADRFEVSKRTIYRDLDTLNQAGIPIVSYSGMGGGISVMDGYKWKNQILSGSDAKRIFTALHGLRSIDGDSSVTALLAKLVPDKEAAVFSQSDYVIDLSSWFYDSIIYGKIKELRRAVENRQCVRVEYVSKSSRAFRVVEPHKLVFKQSQWYLYAYCREKESFRLFKLGRIVSFELLEEAFKQRPVNQIDFALHHGSDIFSGYYQDGFSEVVLEYEIFREFELTDKIDASFFAGIGRSSDRGEIRFFTPDLAGTADYIMGIADKVMVVSPPELLEEIKNRIGNMNSYYKG